jgi:hypothetical protein
MRVLISGSAGHFGEALVRTLQYMSCEVVGLDGQADELLESTRNVAYVSAEFLVGHHLGNNVLNLGITETARQAVTELGLDLEQLVGLEEEPGLGNRGLGRLVACYLDSLATLGYLSATVSATSSVYSIRSLKILLLRSIEANRRTCASLMTKARAFARLRGRAEGHACWQPFGTERCSKKGLVSAEDVILLNMLMNKDL